MKKSKIISIILPVYNEEQYIEKCLTSILNFQKPNDYDFEIIITDGNSTDNTLNIVKNKFGHLNNIIIINNPNRYQSYGLNLGIKLSKGEYILRLDAHAHYPTDYLKLCYHISKTKLSDNTGGIIITEPGSDSFSGLIVQALTTHKFGVGNSSFRVKSFSGEVDTVPYGFFKKEIFEKIGYFDERLIRCQDYEFNSRILNSGGKIWIDSRIQITYYNQPDLYSFLKKQMLKEAPYNAYMWYLAPYSFTIRHAITGIFCLGLILGLIISPINYIIMYAYICTVSLYLILGIISSFQQAFRYKDFKLIAALPISFFLFHFIHGLGIIYGALSLLLNIAPSHIRR